MGLVQTSGVTACRGGHCQPWSSHPGSAKRWSAIGMVVAVNAGQTLLSAPKVFLNYRDRKKGSLRKGSFHPIAVRATPLYLKARAPTVKKECLVASHRVENVQ